jgi:hypothetical protein
MRTFRSIRLALSVLIAIALPTLTRAADAVDANAPLAMHAAMPPVSSALIDEVRRATDAFRTTVPADYIPLFGCVSGPEEGAMGIHFVNLGLVGDGVLDPGEPEALIYEPVNGHLRLVGVEFIVDVAQWMAGHDNDQAAPVLEGHLLQRVEKPNRFGLDPFYELHVWAWQDNPKGAFADWNTQVSCERP